MAIFDGIKVQIQMDSKVLCREIAELVIERADKQCPVDTGRLLNSHFVEDTNTGAVCGYDTEYAVFVHEKRNHDKHSFLTKGLNEVLSVLDEDVDIIAERVILSDD